MGLMAVVLNEQLVDVATVVQYEDDSVEARYSDGARISLSACGAALARRESGKSASGAVSHQFTRFAARQCRDRVRELLRFRNYFAERPYVCSILLADQDAGAKVSKKPLKYGIFVK